MPYCPDCGIKVSDQAAYCHECGAQIPGGVESSSEAVSEDNEVSHREDEIQSESDVQEDTTEKATGYNSSSEPEYDTGAVVFLMAFIVGVVMGIGASNLPGIAALVIAVAAMGGTYYFLRGRTYKSEVLRDGLYVLAVAFPIYAILYYSTSNPFLLGSALLGAFMVSAITAGGGYLAHRYARSMEENG